MIIFKQRTRRLFAQLCLPLRLPVALFLLATLLLALASSGQPANAQADEPDQPVAAAPEATTTVYTIYLSLVSVAPAQPTPTAPPVRSPTPIPSATSTPSVTPPPFSTLTPTPSNPPPPSNATYGAGAVGEAQEACATEGTILATTDDWETQIADAAPGTTLLLRAGVYQTTDKLKLPSGTAEQWITLKPYNCEAVTLYTSIRPGSYNIIAGLRIEALGIADITWTIRVDGKNGDPIRQVIIRNNTILGGEKDALKVSADVANLTITGNHIDGGKISHVLNVQADETTTLPDQIFITNNLLTKSHFKVPSEDMIQITEARHVEFSHNTCANGYMMEQCVDIKETQEAVIVKNNLFDGSTLHQGGDGVDGSLGCMVIHEHDGHAETHVIEQNMFRNCQDTIIRFASEGGIAISSGTLRYNVFISPTATDADGLLIWRAVDVRFENNTMIRGTLKLGKNGEADKIPQNTVLKNNLFYQSRIDDRTQPPATTHQCTYNLFFQTSGNLDHARCQNSLRDVDPLLTNITAEDLRPASTSPACSAGEGGGVEGALPCATVVD